MPAAQRYQKAFADRGREGLSIAVRQRDAQEFAVVGPPYEAKVVANSSGATVVQIEGDYSSCAYFSAEGGFRQKPLPVRGDGRQADDRVEKRLPSVASIQGTRININPIALFDLEIQVATRPEQRVELQRAGGEAARRGAVIERSDPNVGFTVLIGRIKRDLLAIR